MKRNWFYICVLLTLALSLITSCTEEINGDDGFCPSDELHYLSVEPRDLVIEQDGSKVQGIVKSNEEWMFTNIPAWMTVSPARGQGIASFSIVADPNEITTRTDTIYLVSHAGNWTTRKPIAVTQKIKYPYIKDYSFTVKNTASEFVVKIDTNVGPIQVKKLASWLFASYKDKELRIIVTENTSPNPRHATIDLHPILYGIYSNVYITQEGTDGNTN